MDEEEKTIDRRTVLKTTGVALATTGAFSANVAAAPSSQNDCCPNLEVIEETDEHQIILVERDGKTFKFTVSKETGKTTGGEVASSIDQSQLDSPDSIGTLNHQDIFTRTGVNVSSHGSCGGYIYSNHYSIVFAFETGDTLDSIPSATVAAATCAAIGSRAGHPAIAALAAAACAAFELLVLSHIDFSGRTSAIGAWDCHQGTFNEEYICIGGINYYTLSRWDLEQLNRIGPGAHLELGTGTRDYL